MPNWVQIHAGRLIFTFFLLLQFYAGYAIRLPCYIKPPLFQVSCVELQPFFKYSVVNSRRISFIIIAVSLFYFQLLCMLSL